MDVKYVPTACYAGTDDEKFYQYTMIEEASRERFIYAYLRQCYIRSFRKSILLMKSRITLLLKMWFKRMISLFMIRK